MVEVARRQSTLSNPNAFAHEYSQRLLRRVENRLRRSAKNRSRKEYAQGYNEAANRIKRLIK